VTFVPLDATRSVCFRAQRLAESRKHRDGRQAPDRLRSGRGRRRLARPSVRIDLGSVMPANQPFTLRFAGAAHSFRPKAAHSRPSDWPTSAPKASYLMYARAGSLFMTTRRPCDL
jgi:hypothetical protein